MMRRRFAHAVRRAPRASSREPMTRPTRTRSSSSAGAMTFEKHGVSRWDFKDPYHFALTLSWPEFFAVLVLAYVAINLGFALVYFALPGSIANLPPKSFADAFFFSVETLATVGYGTMAPATLAGHLVATLEVFIGMMFTATTTGLAFVRFSRPKAKILFAGQMVVTRLEGRPVLMVRVGNGRPYALTDAVARMTVLVSLVDGEGRSVRRAVDLPLRHAEFPFFPHTWTLMHDIDAASPLAGLDPSTIAERHLRLMLSVTARDPALGADVRAAHSYAGTEIAYGMRYAKAVSWDGDDTSIADMTRVGLIEPDTSG
jgi:inward rectifier potassium channel